MYIKCNDIFVQGAKCVNFLPLYFDFILFMQPGFIHMHIIIASNKQITEALKSVSSFPVWQHHQRAVSALYGTAISALRSHLTHIVACNTNDF